MRVTQSPPEITTNDTPSHANEKYLLLNTGNAGGEAKGYIPSTLTCRSSDLPSLTLQSEAPPSSAPALPSRPMVILKIAGADALIASL